MSEHRVVISEEVSLHALDQILDEKSQPRIGNGVDRYVVDLSGLRYMSAPSAVNLLLLLDYLKSISKEKPILMPPRSSRVVSFLSNVRFFFHAEGGGLCILGKRLSVPDPVDTKVMAEREILEIRHISLQSSDAFYQKLGRGLQGTLFEKFHKMGGEQLEFIAEIYYELSKNIHEHSRSYGYVSAQVIEKESASPRICITVGDMGIGIFKSLDVFRSKDTDGFDSKYGPVWDEAKALDIAFIPGVSSKRVSIEEEGGYGLSSVLEEVKMRQGTLVCRTGENKVFLGYWDGEWRTARKTDLHPFPGTQLEVSIPL